MKKLGKGKIREIQRYRGMTGKEISAITGVGINTVYKYMWDKRTEKNWSEWEMQRLCKWRSEGVSYAEIARRLHRSEMSVKVKMCRHRKEVKNDPKMRIAFYYLGKALRLEPNPTLALRAVRKARIFEIGEDLKDER